MLNKLRRPVGTIALVVLAVSVAQLAANVDPEIALTLALAAGAMLMLVGRSDRAGDR